MEGEVTMITVGDLTEYEFDGTMKYGKITHIESERRLYAHWCITIAETIALAKEGPGGTWCFENELTLTSQEITNWRDKLCN